MLYFKKGDEVLSRRLTQKQENKIKKKLKKSNELVCEVKYSNISIMNDGYGMKKETHIIPNRRVILNQIQNKIEEIGDIFDGTKHATLFEISEMFNKVLMYQIPLSSSMTGPANSIRILESSFLPLNTTVPFSIKKGYVSFRVRNDSSLMEKELNDIVMSDFWNAPSEYVKLGRLNKPNESLFYLANSPQTAIMEMKMKPGDYGFISIYTCEEELKLKSVLSDGSGLNELMFRLFSEEVEMTEEHKYLLTQEIVNRYFARSDEDGWVYPSIANGMESHCVAIDEKQLYKLSFNISMKIQILEEGVIKVESLLFPDINGRILNCPLENKILSTNPDDFIEILSNYIK